MIPFPCKTVNRAQQRNKTGKIEIFGTTKNVCPYQNKFGERSQNMSGIVTTAGYNRVNYIIVYIFFLIHYLCTS